MNDYKEKIVGGWRNNDIEYKFEIDGTLSIYWVHSNSKAQGNWRIQGNNQITFNYKDTTALSWKGKVDYIKNYELSITEECNGIDLIHIMFRDNLTKDPTKIGLTKYIFSRFIFVFFVLSAYAWIWNIDRQVIDFFDAYKGSFLYYVLIILIGIVAISFYLISFTGVFNLLQESYSSGLENVLKRLTLKRISKYILASPFLIVPLLEYEFYIEKEHKRYTFPFVALGIIVILFVKGSPLINNYSAVYLNYEVPTTNGGTSYEEQKTYVFDKNDKALINKNISKVASKEYLEDNLYEIEDNNLDYYGTTRNYLFQQTAEIEGFEFYDKSNKGIFDYISCLIYFFIEKLIVTIIFFLMPFLVWIGVDFYKNKS